LRRAVLGEKEAAPKLTRVGVGGEVSVHTREFPTERGAMNIPKKGKLHRAQKRGVDLTEKTAAARGGTGRGRKKGFLGVAKKLKYRNCEKRKTIKKGYCRMEKMASLHHAV